MMSHAYNALDVDPKALLKELGGDFVTTNNEFGDNAIDLNELDAQYWGTGETTSKQLSVCIQVEDFDDNGNFSRVYIYVNSVPNDISGATRPVFLVPPTPGFYSYTLDLVGIRRAYPDFRYLFSQAGLGTGSTIKYGAWIAPVPNL
jgi:hypothetical protein